MQDINCWEEKFEVCEYAARLLDKVTYLNTLVKQPVDLREIKKGIYYARKYHGTQMRQSGDPYYSHPIEVAYMAAEFTAYRKVNFFTADTIITSLLHDTIEDTYLSEKMITKIFGREIAIQVEALTRVKIDNKLSAAEIMNILFYNENTKLLIIKLCDRFHNLQTIRAQSPEKQRKTVHETLVTFLPIASTVHYELENKLIQLCLSILNEHEENANFLAKNNFQMLSLTF
ncbi:HD domain-containing protein [Rickettsia endosymbiont of Halotydeus destructor]|uniref:HD domain-containing protein n=1 Tax=Rickettsia endosymbiont of Halotydeus destructor TaxID=2996754 RepID=UPI003BB1C47E